MKDRMIHYMEDWNMTRPGDRVIVALSGGGDSVCLLHLLSLCSGELGIHLTAVHVHHGIRGDEADRDALFSEMFCETRGIPFVLHRVNVPEAAAAGGMSLEEAGRELRYEVLEEERVRQGARVIAVAHHMDDSAETILHNLFRGSGLRGITGIDPVRGRIIRPLLCFRRPEILHCLSSQGIEYCSDSTNEAADYTRNRIRLEILPKAEQVNGRAVENMVRTGEFVRQAHAYFQGMASRVLDGQPGPEIPVSFLHGRTPLEVSYILMELARRAGGSLKDFGSVHVKLLTELAEKPTGSSLDLPGGIRAYCEYGVLRLVRKDREEPIVRAREGLVFDIFSYEKAGEIPKNQYTKWFDYDKIKDTLSVRHREPGDYFMLSSGGRKTVKAFMIDEKIPREQRDRILVLADGKHVLWIVGYRISEYYKVTDQTRRILQVRLDGGNTHG